MKFYMSYWSGGYYNKIDQYVLDMHKLSVHLIKKHYGECYMITDSICKPYFESTGFTNISTELDFIEKFNYNWALGKLFTYKILSENNIAFTHVDYDVMLWKPLPVELLNKDVFTQSLEINVYKSYKLDLFDRYSINRHNIPNVINETAYNMGIFGGNNLKFIQDYANAAITLSLDKSNELCYKEMVKHASFSVACMCEQYYLKIYSDIKNIKISCLLEDKLYEEQEKLANELGYTHLNSIKHDTKVKEHLYLRMKELNLK